MPYWFTNLLWWGLGPALEIWALAGVVWLLVAARSAVAPDAAAFPDRLLALGGPDRHVAPLHPLHASH